MKNLKIILIIAFVILVAALGFIYKYYTDNSKDSIEIKSKISGKILELNVENNAKVKSGEIVIVIDTKQYDDKLLILNEKLENIQNDLKISTDDLYKIKAINKKTNDDIKSAKLALDIANSDYVLYKNAFKDGAVTKKDLSNAKKNLEIANNRYNKVLENNSKTNKQLEEIILKNELQNTEIKNITDEIEKLRALISCGTVVSPLNGKIKLKVKSTDTINSGDILFTVIKK